MNKRSRGAIFAVLACAWLSMEAAPPAQRAEVRGLLARLLVRHVLSHRKSSALRRAA